MATGNGKSYLRAVFDPGHSDVKFRVNWGNSGSTHIDFPHMMASITAADFRRVERQQGKRQPEAFHVKFNSEDLGYYAVGMTAKDHQLAQLTRERRYFTEYVGGGLLCGAIAHAFDSQPGFNRLMITGLYPIEDDHAADELIDAITGTWEIKVANGPDLKFQVRCEAQPEGMAGMLCAAIDEKGNERRGWKDSSILAFDLGGGTFQVAGFEKKWNMILHRTFPLGVNSELETFIHAVRVKFPELVPSVSSANRIIFRESLREERWTRRGRYDLLELARESKTRLMNKLNNDILSAISLPDYQKIVLLGGGAGLLWNSLLTSICHFEEKDFRDKSAMIKAAEEQEVYFALHNLDEIQYANVRGAELSAKLLVE